MAIRYIESDLDGGSSPTERVCEGVKGVLAPGELVVEVRFQNLSLIDCVLGVKKQPSQDLFWFRFQMVQQGFKLSDDSDGGGERFPNLMNDHHSFPHFESILYNTDHPTTRCVNRLLSSFVYANRYISKDELFALFLFMEESLI